MSLYHKTNRGSGTNLFIFNQTIKDQPNKLICWNCLCSISLWKNALKESSGIFLKEKKLHKLDALYDKIYNLNGDHQLPDSRWEITE